MNEIFIDIILYQNAFPSKYLAGINDQISQAVSCGEEFPDDDTYQAEAYIYFHIADDRRDGTWQYHLCQCMEAIAAQSIDQLDLAGIHRGEAGVEA